MKRRHILLVVLVVVAGAAIGAAVGAYLALSHDLPSIQGLENYRPSAVSRVVSQDGIVLAQFFVERRIPVPLHKIPLILRQAVIATEDRRFYEHAGIDWRGIVRALVKDLLALRLKEGGSTITQQLAKVLFLSPEKTLSRKLKEAILALQIERRYSKDEILALYLNQIYLGGGAYGVEAAANRYFGKHVWELNLAECALIAGLPRAPTRYSPLRNPELARARRETVLRLLHQEGYINTEELEQALTEPLRLAPTPAVRVRAPYFVEYLRPQLEEILGENLLYRGGVTVKTTLWWDWQRGAELALERGLQAVERRHPRLDQRYGEPCQGAVVIIDAANGAIRAMVGGRDFQESQFNRATQARRQPGSAFKPIVYGYALTRGYTQADLIWDAPVSYPQVGGGRWEPRNYSGTYLGEITLRKALEVSENVAAVRLLERLGPGEVVDFAHKLGITSPLRPNLSLALGTSEVTLLELAGAYQVFANGGLRMEPTGIEEILAANGTTLYRAQPKPAIVLRRQEAYIITDMLTGVVQRGTARKAKALAAPLAGKTGTTEDNRDAWFVGYSPEVVAGVWVGYDSYQPLGPGETGARAALPVWMETMKRVLADTGVKSFPRPDNIKVVTIDAITGRQAGAECQDVTAAAFVAGTEPAEVCEHRHRAAAL